ncbi:MAG TPA: helical backbone metal receptor [Rubrivivax sp.]|nr:helical backbone metal receptor [Rubrivivax sp.]
MSLRRGMTTQKHRWLPLLALFGALVFGEAGTASPAVQVADDRGRTLTLAAPPQRIVSLLPSLTETVCELRACDRMVGTDRFSNWPEAVRALPKLGGLEDSQIERIVALKPDLVLAAVSARAIDRLEALGLPVLALEPRNGADARRVIERIALALGEPAAGTALVARIESRVAAAAARVPAALQGRTVYFEVAANPYAAGEASFVGELLARLGLVNIVPAAMGPFPQLNPEFVLRAQPALVMATAAAVAEMPGRPGWRSLRALQQGHACGFDAGSFDMLVRPGPRLGDAAEAIADCLLRLGPMP